MRTSRDTSKYTNQFLKLFEEYRNENVNIRKWLTRFEATFKEVSNLQNSIKKDIDEKVDNPIKFPVSTCLKIYAFGHLLILLVAATFWLCRRVCSYL